MQSSQPDALAFLQFFIEVQTFKADIAETIPIDPSNIPTSTTELQIKTEEAAPLTICLDPLQSTKQLSDTSSNIVPTEFVPCPFTEVNSKDWRHLVLSPGLGQQNCLQPLGSSPRHCAWHHGHLTCQVAVGDDSVGEQALSGNRVMPGKLTPHSSDAIQVNAQDNSKSSFDECSRILDSNQNEFLLSISI
ncbi:hypothetical protein VNO77_37891 [Canavalia gladiata]|uniref:Uncharacterized protein n=1 Tax=Canavalia gladiata TaxID=3824 RepID=A0AAN9PW99_CANGL